jgi:hypothetical protein
MKSYVLYLQGLYSAMLSDIAERFPSLRKDSERDASRLLSLVNSRGLSFLMIDLPDAGKHFDRALSSGRLTRSGLAASRPYRTGVIIPRLFKGLLLRVFDEFGVLRADSDVAAISALRQLYYGAKKVKIDCDDSRTWEHVHEFFETDRKVRSPSLYWDEDELGIDAVGSLHFGDSCSANPAPLFGICDSRFTDCEESLSELSYGAFDAAQRVADIVAATLGTFDGLEWRAKHGPGAVADQRHTQFKYDFPFWPVKLQNAFPLAEYGFANLGMWADFLNGDEASFLFSEHEPPSRLIAVPKTLKGPRLIAAEPVSHQWCQQLIKDYFTSRLQHTPISQSIHFRDQTENQEFARRASHTQSHVTVDLSSASDRVSCWVVERLFRRIPSLVVALHASRTRWISNEIDKNSPRFHKLRKFSCMGSACTFPVQSYLFTTLAIASLLYSRKQAITIRNVRRASQEVRVFGDDIIIPEDGWEMLQGLLGHLGLKVNPQKTYDSGNFRESCGLDAYDGNDVTPTYSMTYPGVSRPESIASCVATHNNFVLRRWWRTAQFVKSRVASLKRFRFANVPIGSGAFGWFDHMWDGNNHLESRWNDRLHRVEYRMDTLSVRTKRCLPKSDSLLLQFFTVARDPVEFLLGERLGVAERPSISIRRRWETIG